MLLASGFIAGGSLAGVLIAFMNFLPGHVKEALDFEKLMEGAYKGLQDPDLVSGVPQLLALVIFLGLAAVLLLTGAGKMFRSPPETAAPPGGIGTGNGQT
jgi:hypothetical protein